MWGMTLNLKKCKSLIVSRSISTFAVHPPLIADGIVIDEVKDLKLLGIVLDSKLTFEKYVRSLSANIVRLCIIT